MMAAKKGNIGIVRKLVHHGANVKLANKVNQVLVLKFERKTANSNKLRHCISTKLMCTLKLWIFPDICNANFVNFPGFCSLMIVHVMSSFEHDELYNPMSPSVVLLYQYAGWEYSL